MTGQFEFFEHTADVGIRATGATLAEAFEAAALGLVTHIADPARVTATKEHSLFLESATVDELLVDWLEEVRFLGEVDHVVFARFHVEIRPGAPARLAGKAWGEPYDAAKHGHLHEVKAVTRHGLKVETTPPKVEVILDI